MKERVETTANEPADRHRELIETRLDNERLSSELDAARRETERLIVRGTVEPGARVIVGDRSVETDETGAFELELTLRLGPNVIVVRAIDEAGNVTYHSQYVNAKF